MKKIKEKLNYKFDNLMSKGPASLVGMLFLITVVVVILFGFLSFLVADGSFLDNVWSSLMHTIDAGTIAGDETSNGLFILVMSIVTLSGIFVTSILIGIITTGFEEKLNELRKGSSKVIEKNHTLILGFNESIVTFIKELIIANESEKNAKIVVLAQEDKEDVENFINDQISDFKTTKVICRTGSITDLNMLKKVSIESAKSIIINCNNDYETIKSILVINSYLKTITGDVPHIVATINEEENLEVARIAGEDNAEIIFASEAISKIIAQSCRQPGLSNVLVELFDYDGCELYFENFKELAGIKFKDVLNYFNDAVVFGYKRGNDICINPNKNNILEENDLLIILAEDNNVAKPLEVKVNEKVLEKYITKKKASKLDEKILILGNNNRLERILLELDEYSSDKTSVIVASKKDNNLVDNVYKNIKVNYKKVNVDSKKDLEKVTGSDIDQILVLSVDDEDTNLSDSKTLLRLINLKNIKDSNGYKFLVTSEMNEPENQKLAEVTKVNDLVIGSNIINLILTQISENKDLAEVFRILLSSEGSEIYTKKVTNYIKTESEIDFHLLTSIVSKHDEVLIGYKKVIDDNFEIIINPSKMEKIKFEDSDELIVLAND